MVTGWLVCMKQVVAPSLMLILLIMGYMCSSLIHCCVWQSSCISTLLQYWIIPICCCLSTWRYLWFVSDCVIWLCSEWQRSIQISIIWLWGKLRIIKTFPSFLYFCHNNLFNVNYTFIKTTVKVKADCYWKNMVFRLVCLEVTHSDTDGWMEEEIL